MTLAAVTEARPVMIGDLEVVPDLSGALVLPDLQALVVADLHLEKGSAFAARGRMLPPYDTSATLARLSEVIARLKPRLVIALGDSFHDTGASGRMAASDLQMLTKLQAGRDWLWIAGNHDPHLPDGISGDVAEELALSGVTFRHEPSTGNNGPEIAGHLHPAAKVRMQGRAVRRRCFAIAPDRCIMPAMGAFAGGLNVRNAAFAPLFRRGLSAHMLGDRRLYVIGGSMLLPD
jgi:uncharacterized protein